MATTTAAPAEAAAPVAPAAAAPAVAAAAAAAPAAYTSASLYVGDLKQEVTETLLFDIFKQCGTVTSIRVCRDAISRRSLGYAYVNFHNPAEAESALDKLNHTPIVDRPCRIMWCTRDPSKRRSNVGNIFIKNLDKSITAQQLSDTFSTFGNIMSCKVATDEEGKSKGFGYVHFEREEDAQKAMEATNGKNLMNKTVTVSPFRSWRERKVELERSGVNLQQRRFTNVYAKNMETPCTEESVRALFAPFGEITSVAVRTHDEKPFAFVNFTNQESAQRAVDALHGKEPAPGKPQMYVQPAQKRAQRQRELRTQFERFKADNAAKHPGMNLYVRNLADTIDDDELRNKFSVYGTITSAKVMRDEVGRSKGFGFVCFATNEEAIKAVSEMNGALVQQKPLYVAIAMKKEQRHEQLRQLHLHRGGSATAAHMAGYPQYAQPIQGMWYQQGMAAQQQQQQVQAQARMMQQSPYAMQRMGWMQRQQRYYPMMPMAAAQMQQMPAAQQQAMAAQMAQMQQMQQQQQQQMPQQQYQMSIQRRGAAAPMQGRMQRMNAPMQGRQGPRQGPRSYPQQQMQQQQQQVVAAPVVAAVPVAVAAPAPVSEVAPESVVAVPAAAAAAPAEEAVNNGPLSAAEFEALSKSNELRQTLGERLFEHIMSYFPAEQKCGKLTGMLLESMDMVELNTLLGDAQGLKVKIDEADAVFEDHQRRTTEAVAVGEAVAQ